MDWRRRLRGILGTGATWGAFWGLLGAGVGFVLGVVDPRLWTVTSPVLEWAVGIGLYGFVSGVGFATLLTLREGRKTLHGISLPRVGLWGVLGAAAVPLLFGGLGMFDAGTTTADILGAILTTSALGAVSAPTSVALARRAALEAGEAPRRLEGSTG